MGGVYPPKGRKKNCGMAYRRRRGFLAQSFSCGESVGMHIDLMGESILLIHHM